MYEPSISEVFALSPRHLGYTRTQRSALSVVLQLYSSSHAIGVLFYSSAYAYVTES